MLKRYNIDYWYDYGDSGRDIVEDEQGEWCRSEDVDHLENLIHKTIYDLFYQIGKYKRQKRELEKQVEQLENAVLLDEVLKDNIKANKIIRRINDK